MATMNSMDHDRIDPNMPRASTLGRPPPNPPFVFPMQPEPAAREDSSWHDLPSENMSNRRSKTRSRPQQLSISHLPDFKFQPSPETSETSVSVTPSSPSKSRMIPPHQGGHRRNGSEFIGGDGKSGLTGLMSTSPKKGEGILPPPPGARTGPPAGRRGHAHRRSGAVSSHDVSAIFKPANEPRGGSAPASPSEPGVRFSLVPKLDRSLSQPAITAPSQDASPAAHRRQASLSAGQTRPRVGFSDHVEFIPRPLSTISSETSSSLSTIRPSHSLTGSISSIISIGNASPHNVKVARSPSQEIDRLELSLAPSLGPQSNEKCSTSHSLLESSTASPSPECTNPGDLPSWTDAFRNPPTENESNSADDDDHAVSIRRLSIAPTASRTRRRPVSLHNPTLARPRSSPEPKVSKRQQKKVKSWAGSILARKARESMEEAQISPSIPPPSSAVPGDLSLEDLTFDEDTSCVIQTAPSPTHKLLSTRMDSSSPRFNANCLNSDNDVDESGLVLDLDAALGTSSPTSLGPSFEEVTGSRNAAARRRLHSSGGTGSFDGPGMHYHRRAESAPEMAPINRQIFGFSRLGSNQAMADVFEEDEDNITDVAAAGESIAKTSQGLGVAVLVDGHNTGSRSERISKEWTATALDLKDGYPPLQDTRAGSTTPTVDQTDLGTIDIVCADEEPRVQVSAKPPYGAGATSTSTSERFTIGRPASAPVLYTLPAPSPAFTAPDIDSSAISTPDFCQTSFENPRLHTATSSMTDRATLSSFRMGEHGFDTRGSVDDVPSLTSSASTMASAYPPRTSSSAPTRTSADKPSSLSSVPVVPRTRPGNASKRSSLASLSRLVGGSSGERSKLNLTEYAQPEEKEKTEKKRGKRISRLMRWWRPKEKVASS
ncbi:MAG: hypothetical protein L6R42_002246 [Xanthoria sp. 1 TBL-2021]|nr:MAG: hypothetical protein L6R42_002246 [Xanthoria sp. 1 TBL-2021]